MTSKQWRLVLRLAVSMCVASTVTAFLLWAIAILTACGGKFGALGALFAAWAIVTGITWGCTYDRPGRAEAWERLEQDRLDKTELEKMRTRMYERSRSVLQLQRQLQPISPDAAQMVREWWENGEKGS
jgi:hypothetical protein